MLSFMAALASLAFIFTSCRRDAAYTRTEGMIWNTSYHITFKGAPELEDSILAVLDGVGKSLNVFDENSLISKINRADSMETDAHFRSVYKGSARLHDASGGMFDPTLSPLITAWGFGKGHEVTADTAAVDSILKFVGFGKTRLRGDSIIKGDRRIQFNFSAIAKGYGCDCVATMLERNGVKDYLVEIGGEIAVGGKGPGKDGWLISVDKPIESEGVIHDSGAVVRMKSGGMATSGNYRNFHRAAGKSFGHTISPVTGRPVATDVISATVVAPSSMEADAAATVCMAVGSAESERLLKKLGYDAMLIRNDSTVWMTEGFSTLIVNAESSEPGRRGRN